MSAHSLAETYSVLTNLPLKPRIVPAEAKLIIETNLLPFFRCVALTQRIYERALRRCVALGCSGGIMYDALLVECAQSIHADRIIAFNTRDFQRLSPELAERITAP